MARFQICPKEQDLITQITHNMRLELWNYQSYKEAFDFLHFFGIQKIGKTLICLYNSVNPPCREPHVLGHEGGP